MGIVDYELPVYTADEIASMITFENVNEIANYLSQTNQKTATALLEELLYWRLVRHI